MIVAVKKEFGILCLDEEGEIVVADFSGVRFPTPEEIAGHRWFRGNGVFRFGIWGIQPDAQAKVLDLFGGRGAKVVRVGDFGSLPPRHFCVACFRDEKVAVEAMRWLRGLGFLLMPAEPGMEENAPRLPGRRPLPGPGV